jgi:hypothetical protein
VVKKGRRGSKKGLAGVQRRASLLRSVEKELRKPDGRFNLKKVLEAIREVGSTKDGRYTRFQRAGIV